MESKAETPSRLLMLTRLRQSPCSVGELAEAIYHIEHLRLGVRDAPPATA